MEFDVIDPKDHSFDEWLLQLEAFLDEYCRANKTRYDRLEGEVYFTHDEIADIWGEESVLYRVYGERGGYLEARGADEQVYLFIEEFAGRNLKDSKDGNTFHLTKPRAVYGFKHNTEGREDKPSFFHGHTSKGVYFLHMREEEEFVLPISLDELKETSGGLREIIQWVHNQTNKLQEQKNIAPGERQHHLLTLKATFTHPALSGNLIEALRSRTAVKERDDQGLIEIQLLNPNNDYLQDVFSKLPGEAEFVKDLTINMSWGVEYLEGERAEITYLGAEKRALRPLIQLPKKQTSQALKDAFKAYFKGYRVIKYNYTSE
jgi:hypothetical protein